MSTKDNREYLVSLNGENADGLLAETCSAHMKEKLAKKREQGRHGWHHDCSNKVLLQMLESHVRKGDMVDVMNLAGMIHMREYYGVEPRSAPPAVHKERLCRCCTHVDVCVVADRVGDILGENAGTAIDVLGVKTVGSVRDVYHSLANCCLKFDGGK